MQEHTGNNIFKRVVTKIGDNTVTKIGDASGYSSPYLCENFGNSL